MQHTETDKPLTKMQRYRAKLRAQGLRPVQIWVPDRRNPRVLNKLKREAARLAKHSSDKEALDFIEKVLDDSGWEW